VDGNLHSEGGYLATSPVIAGKYLIIATLNGDILLMDHESGKTIKKYEIKDAVRSQPIAMNGWIYVTSTSGYLYAINTNESAVSGWPMLGVDNKHSNKIL
ncbi:MAG: PQQ-binding-like beta-propeller repeat protein, partial [Chitinophagales bacterium]